MTAFAVLSVLVLSSVSWSGTDAVYRLPNDSFPLSYVIHLEPDIMEKHFFGTVTIDFNMTITSSVLVINQKNLIIRTIEMDGKLVKNWHANHDTQMLTMYCGKDLEQDRTHRVKIVYEGTLTDLKNGFYISKYITGNETKWMAATQFEATSARLAFPCWDEPIYKAVFNISINHLSNYTTVISNMPILNQTRKADNTITTYFHRTMLMSTYLVAFVVSDYAYTSYGDDRFKIFTTPDSLHKTELAYNFSLEAMKVLDEYTEIPYFNIAPKMDQVTIADPKSNAMENWGIVTYRENLLLYEEGVTTSKDKNNIILTIAHEFAHQWFGNLVSPKWWEFIWLNEGFAKYFQFFVTDKVKPSWRLMDVFPVDVMQKGAFIADVRIARALNKNADHPSSIAALFDTISYQKAACVIRMLSYVLTEQVFHTGLKNYLRENSFNVADSDNLIKHLQHAAGENKTWGGVALTEIARTWITQPGYPMVTVKKTNPEYFTLSQQHFSFYNTDKKKLWWIPITYATNRNLNFTDTSVTHWMNPNAANPPILEPEADWLLLNKQQAGYYRVNYDDEIWQKLTEYLKSSNMHRIHPVNRAQLIDDALVIARTNYTKYETALSLTLYLNREVDYIPWMAAFKNLKYLRQKISPSKHYNIFKYYIRYIMHSLTKKLTYVASPKDDHPTKLLKQEAMKWACLADIQECLNETRKEFNAWLKDPMHRLDPDLKSTILCTGLRTASEEVWDEVLKKLSHETFDNNGKTNPLEVLGCSVNRTILQKFLIYSGRTDGKIKFETAVKAVLTNPNVMGVEIVQYILDFELMKITSMQDFDDQLSSVVKSLSSAVTNNEDFLRLSKFVVSRRPSDKSMITRVKMAMRSIKWMATYARIIDGWLLKNEKLFKSCGTGKTFVSLLLILSIFNTIIFKIFL